MDLLTYNKPIRRRNIRSRGNISERPKRVSRITGTSLEKRVHVYHMWYRFLRLALEMEQRNIPITTTKGDFKVVVNRRRYAGWDIDTILEHTFRDETDWWRNHAHLFTQVSVEEVTSIDDVDFSTSHRYFKISTEKKVSEVVRELKFLLEKQKKGKKAGQGKTALYTTTGEVRYYAYRDAYSALVMKINGMRNKEIAKFLVANDAREPAKRMTDESWYRISDVGTFKTSKMRDVLNTGKRAVLAVADGYFPKHPKKTYF